MTGIITNLEKSTAPAIDSFDDRLRDLQGRHIVKRDRTKNCSRKSKTPSSIKERGMPFEEVLITRREERKTIVDRNFVGRQRESEISLRERGHSGAQSIIQFLGHVRLDGDRQEYGLVIIDGQARGLLKQL
jgi:glutaredoxin